MLRIHQAVVVICCTYSGQMADQSKNLARDRFYHGLVPSLRDALEFMMADLPESEQAGASFDTLFTLAKKMEACQPNCTHQGQGSSDSYYDRYWRSPTPVVRVTMLAEMPNHCIPPTVQWAGRLLPPDALQHDRQTYLE